MTVTTHGYRVVRIKGVLHYVHRLVAEEKIGRPLTRADDVHHINGDGLDNRPENLEVLTRAEHKKMHRSNECKRGHDLTNPDNVYLRPDNGGRQCRSCCLMRNKQKWRKRNNG